MSARSNTGRDRRGAALLLGLGLALGLSVSSALSAQFSAPAGPLSQTLAAFGRQSGLNVTYLPDVASGKRSPGFEGAAEPTEALARILAGTGLTWRFVDASTVELLDAAPVQDVRTAEASGEPLQEIAVEGVSGESAWGPVGGYVARRSATGTKTDAAIVDTPQAINVVTAEEIEKRAPANVAQALRYTPGVTSFLTDGDRLYDNIYVRGAAASTLFLDGMKLPYGFGGGGQLAIDPYMLERIEVLKGPGSTLYGQTGFGGIVNMVSKRPSLAAGNEVQASVGSFGRKTARFDVNGALGEEERFVARLVGVASDGGAQIDHRDEGRVLLAPSVTVRPTDATTLTLLGHFQRDRGLSDLQALPAIGTLYAGPFGRRIPRDRNIGEPDFEHFRRDQWALGYAFEHKFSDALVVRQNLRYASSDINQRSTFGFGFLPDGLYDRSADDTRSKLRNFSVDTHVEAGVATGPIEHRVLFGVDHFKMRETASLASAFLDPFDIFNPIYGRPIPPLADVYDNRTSFRQTGGYLQDEIRIGRLTTFLGGRLDWSDNAETFTPAGLPPDPTSKAKAKSEFSGRVGVSYRLDGGFHPYASYTTAFLPNRGSDRDRTAFTPTSGEQWEAGVKYQPEGFPGLISVSAFQMDQSKILTPDPVPSPNCPFGCQQQNGSSRLKGIELEGKLEIAENANLIAAYALLDGQYTKGHPAGVKGNDIVAVSRHQFSLWGDYAFASGSLDGFGLGAGVRYASSKYGDTANTLRIPGAMFLDAMVSYDFGRKSERLKGLSFSVNGSNLTDKRYVSSCSADTYCYYAEGRRVLGTLAYRW